MFNHDFQVRLVKRNKKEEPVKVSQTDHEIEGRTAHICYTLDRVIRKAGNVAITYLLIDAARRILIAKIDQPK